MARPLSNDKREAILDAAVRVIALRGLGAPTALIAKEAGVSNGTLFTYFETKADLFNHLFRELKQGMARAALDSLPVEGPVRDQMCHMWMGWLNWAVSGPDKRRTLAHLEISEEITAESRKVASETMSRIVTLIEQSRIEGPMRKAPLELVVALMTGVADATIDFMIDHGAEREKQAGTAFEALWRIVA